MMSLWDALRMNMMTSYQELVRTFPKFQLLAVCYPKCKDDEVMLILRWRVADLGNDSNLLIVFYVQIMPDDFVMQLHRF